MKKFNDRYSLDLNLKSKNNLFINQIKTTNINILLNRVKIEKKNDFKKKIYLTSLMFLTVSLFSVVTMFI